MLFASLYISASAPPTSLYLISSGVNYIPQVQTAKKEMLYVFYSVGCFLFFFALVAIKPACKLDLKLINEEMVHSSFSFFICSALLQQLVTLTSRTLLYQLLFAILTA